MIYFALLKYGYSSFKLEILEYCDSKVLISREQKYLDLFKPEYNILDKAGSSFPSGLFTFVFTLASKDKSKNKRRAAVRPRAEVLNILRRL